KRSVGKARPGSAVKTPQINPDESPGGAPKGAASCESKVRTRSKAAPSGRAIPSVYPRERPSYGAPAPQKIGAMTHARMKPENRRALNVLAAVDVDFGAVYVTARLRAQHVDDLGDLI